MLQTWLLRAQDQLKTTTDASPDSEQSHVPCPMLSRSLGENAHALAMTVLFSVESAGCHRVSASMLTITRRLPLAAGYCAAGDASASPCAEASAHAAQSDTAATHCWGCRTQYALWNISTVCDDFKTAVCCCLMTSDVTVVNHSRNSMTQPPTPGALPLLVCDRATASVCSSVRDLHLPIIDLRKHITNVSAACSSPTSGTALAHALTSR
jgi:hypothetical protein